eukprot:gene17068-18788_t
MFKTSNSIETLILSSSEQKDPGRHEKSKCFLPEIVWLPEDKQSEKFTFPQLSPALLSQETPFSLDSKVPLIPALDDIMVLCTTKLGTKRFRSPQDADFDRTPNSPNLNYNFLHDPHLKKYLSRPPVRKSLVNQGLITEDGFVKCSTKEFNEFRQWIRRLKLNSMEAATRRNAKGENADNKNSKCRQTEHSIQLLETMHRKQVLAKQNCREKKKKDCEERKKLMKNIEQDIRSKEQKKAERIKSRVVTFKQKENEMGQRRASNIRKEKQLKSMRMEQLSEKDEQYMKRKQELSEMRKSRRKKKEAEAIEKWRRRQSYCLKIMQEKKLQLARETQERKNRIKNRNDVLERGRRKMEQALERSTQLSRELASKNLQYANSLMQRTEARKEAEIKRWHDKHCKTSPNTQRNLANFTKSESDSDMPNDDSNARGATNDFKDSSTAYQKKLDRIHEEDVAIPHIEVIECTGSNHSAMSFEEDGPQYTVPTVAVIESNQTTAASSDAAMMKESKQKLNANDDKNGLGEVSSVSDMNHSASSRKMAMDIAKLALMQAVEQLGCDMGRVRSGKIVTAAGMDRQRSRGNVPLASAGSGGSRERRSRLTMTNSSSRLRKKSNTTASNTPVASTSASESKTKEKAKTSRKAVEFVVNTFEGAENQVAENRDCFVDKDASDAGSDSSMKSAKKSSLILPNADSGLQVRDVKYVTKTAVIGAMKELGSDDETLAKVSELVESIIEKTSEKKVVGNQREVRFHDEAENKKTPRGRSKSISERVPTPHASLIGLGACNDDLSSAADSSDVLSTAENDAGVNAGLETSNPSSVCKKLDMQESEESVESATSTEKLEKNVEGGRRATPYFTTTEKKSILADITDRKGNQLLETFTEEEEDEEEEAVEEEEEVEEEEAVEEEDVGEEEDAGEEEEVGEEEDAGEEEEEEQEEDKEDDEEEGRQKENDEQEKDEDDDKASNSEGQSLVTVVAEDHSLNSASSHAIAVVEIEARESMPSTSIEDLPEEDKVNTTSKLQTDVSHNENDVKDSIEESVSSMGVTEVLGNDISNVSSSLMKSDGNSALSGCQLSEYKCNGSSSSKHDPRDSLRRDSTTRQMRAAASKSNSVASGIKLVKDESLTSSQKTLESTSSHFLPKIKPSRSRMVCNLDPSIYSCTSEELSDSDGLNSQEILDSNGEREVVVKIEQRSELDLNEEEGNGNEDAVSFQSDDAASTNTDPASTNTDPQSANVDVLSFIALSDIEKEQGMCSTEGFGTKEGSIEALSVNTMESKRKSGLSTLQSETITGSVDFQQRVASTVESNTTDSHENVTSFASTSDMLNDENEVDKTEAGESESHLNEMDQISHGANDETSRSISAATSSTEDAFEASHKEASTVHVTQSKEDGKTRGVFVMPSASNTRRSSRKSLRASSSDVANASQRTIQKPRADTPKPSRSRMIISTLSTTESSTARSLASASSKASRKLSESTAGSSVDCKVQKSLAGEISKSFTDKERGTSSYQSSRRGSLEEIRRLKTTKSVLSKNKSSSTLFGGSGASINISKRGSRPSAGDQVQEDGRGRVSSSMLSKVIQSASSSPRGSFIGSRSSKQMTPRRKVSDTAAGVTSKDDMSFSSGKLQETERLVASTRASTSQTTFATSATTHKSASGSKIFVAPIESSLDLTANSSRSAALQSRLDEDSGS